MANRMSNGNKSLSIYEPVACVSEKPNSIEQLQFDNDNFISRLLANVANDSYNYNVTIFKQKSCFTFAVRPLTNKHVAIYDAKLLKILCDARTIVIHKITTLTSERRETHFIIILFEKYGKALPGVWLITHKVDLVSYQMFFKYIRVNFPYFKPEEAVVDYDENMQHGLRSVFPEIIIIPSFIHQMQEIIVKAVKTNIAVKMNRTFNAEKHSVLKKFIALSLMPKNCLYACYANLVKECKANYGSYFDSFISYYNHEWMEKWKPEVFCVHQVKGLTKTFLELYDCQQVFGKLTNDEIGLLIFLDKIKITLSKVRENLFSLEHGNILSYYLTNQDEDKENKLYKTWNRLYNNSITKKECLTICSNLLHEDFVDSLIDSAISVKKEY